MNWWKTVCVLVLATVAVVVVVVALTGRVKPPAIDVVLAWDYDRAVAWLENNRTSHDHIHPREGAPTLLHYIAEYRHFYGERATDYAKMQRFVDYFIAQGGNPLATNYDSLTAYDLARKYDSRIAGMIKNAMARSEKKTE